jgi:hypothetical protein
MSPQRRSSGYRQPHPGSPTLNWPRSGAESPRRLALTAARGVRPEAKDGICHVRPSANAPQPTLPWWRLLHKTAIFWVRSTPGLTPRSSGSMPSLTTSTPTARRMCCCSACFIHALEFVFQPKYAAYLNLIEPWWKTLRSLALKGRRFETWAEIAQAVDRATAYWNEYKHPFLWGRRRRHRQPRHLGVAAVPAISLI